MIGMLLLSFGLGYLIFISAAYFLAKFLFPDLDKVAEDQKQEKLLLLKRARRIRRAERVASAKARPSFTFVNDKAQLISHKA